MVDNEPVTIFDYNVSKEYTASLDVLTNLTANLDTKSHARLSYNVVSTAIMKYENDDLEPIVRKWRRTFSKIDTKVYLVVGFHLAKASMNKYNKVAGDVDGNLPFIKINGAIFQEDSKTINQYVAWVQLSDLSYHYSADGDEAISEKLNNALGGNLSANMLDLVISNSDVLQNEKLFEQFKVNPTIQLLDDKKVLSGDVITNSIKDPNNQELKEVAVALDKEKSKG